MRMSGGRRGTQVGGGERGDGVGEVRWGWLRPLASRTALTLLCLRGAVSVIQSCVSVCYVCYSAMYTLLLICCVY